MKQAAGRSRRSAAGRADGRRGSGTAYNGPAGSSSRGANRGACPGFGDCAFDGFTDAAIRDVLLSLPHTIVDFAIGRARANALKLIIGIQNGSLRRAAEERQQA
jgi:hypothetical protein